MYLCVIFVSLFSFIGNIEHCLCYDGFLRYCSVVFSALRPTTHQHSTCVVYRAVTQYMITKICGFFLPCFVMKRANPIENYFITLY